MNWNEFQRAYKAQIRNMAWRLYERWRLPYGVSVEDVEQEMWANAWMAWNAFDPERGNMIREAYAVCTAKQAASRWIHGQRNSLRRSGDAPGRFAIANDQIDFQVSELSTQETALMFAESVRKALESFRGDDRAALAALIEHAFDVDQAATAVNKVDPKETRQKMRRVARAFEAMV
jgi:hypothetical protein